MSGRSFQVKSSFIKDIGDGQIWALYCAMKHVTERILEELEDGNVAGIIEIIFSYSLCAARSDEFCCKKPNLPISLSK